MKRIQVRKAKTAISVAYIYPDKFSIRLAQCINTFDLIHEISHIYITYLKSQRQAKKNYENISIRQRKTPYKIIKNEIQAWNIALNLINENDIEAFISYASQCLKSYTDYYDIFKDKKIVFKRQDIDINLMNIILYALQSSNIEIKQIIDKIRKTFFQNIFSDSFYTKGGEDK